MKYAAANGALLCDVHGSVGAALAMDGNGNVAVTGNYFQPTFLTAKYAAADRAQLWQNHFSTPGNKNDLASAVAVDTAGNVAVTGGSDIANGTSDFYTAKYAAATSRYPPASSNAHLRITGSIDRTNLDEPPSRA